MQIYLKFMFKALYVNRLSCLTGFSEILLVDSLHISFEPLLAKQVDCILFILPNVCMTVLQFLSILNLLITFRDSSSNIGLFFLDKESILQLSLAL